MAAIIRFCFGIDINEMVEAKGSPKEELLVYLGLRKVKYERKYDAEQFAKIFCQAQYCWDYMGLSIASKAINSL